MLAQRHHRTSTPLERRVSEQEYAPQQRVLLSRGVVALCLRRLEHILEHCNSLDIPLTTYLKEQIAAEEESADSLKRLDWTLRRDGDVEFCSTEYDQLLKRYLPSAFGRSGEARMDRDAAFHFVEILETERQAFFSRILQGLSDDPAGKRLKAESDRSADRLRLVRTILLPPPQSVEPVWAPSTAADRRAWVVTVSGQLNRLRELHRASLVAAQEILPPADDWRPAATDLMRDLARAAADADGSDEVLARRFVRELASFTKDGVRNLEDILGVARVALAWLTGGHTRRSRLKTAPAQNVDA